jgi:hypothetical protein
MYCNVCVFQKQGEIFFILSEEVLKEGKSRAFSEHNCPITSARDIRGKEICNGYTHFRREKSKEVE